MTKFGQFQVLEPVENLLFFHHHDATVPLHTVDWEPKNAVLDQEDLEAQGINVAAFIPGATEVDALGSCTANATMSALSNVLSEQRYLDFTKAQSYADAVGIEKAAIEFYHGCTDQTGDPSQEWPPTDCGSSGSYIVEYLQTLGLVTSQKIASGASNIVSLLQTGGILMGGPFLNAWMSPDSNGFVDGDGSLEILRAQIAEGVAGGHETYLCAIEEIATPGNVVDPLNTLLRARNSWTRNWGFNGDYRIHLSTLVALGQYYDFRQLVA